MQVFLKYKYNVKACMYTIVSNNEFKCKYIVVVMGT